MAKNKYRVNYSELTDIDCSVLIEVAARYLNIEEYPSVNVLAAIFAIEEVKEDGDA